MNNNSKNRIEVIHSESVNFNPTHQSTSSQDFRKRKFVWITSSIIILVSIITISIVIFHLKKTNLGNTLTQSTTEITRTNQPLTTTRKGQVPPSVLIHINTQWKRDASTVAGGKGEGDQLNQLNNPLSIYVDDDNKSIYISDYLNHRIVKWKFDGENGEVVAGGNGKGKKMNQLNTPTDAILDKKNNSLIICDYGNEQVLRWYPGNDRYQQIMIANTVCWGLTTDNNEDLYVSEYKNHQVRRWKQGDTRGTIVAGGNQAGSDFNQLWGPRYIFVDEDYSVYVAEFFNARVTKWVKDAKEGIIVAIKDDSGNPDYPQRVSGVIVDHMDNIYMSDIMRCKVTRWLPDAIKGTTAVGMGCGHNENQLFFANDLSFDRHGNLYVVDSSNHRVQKFAVQSN